MVRDAAGRASRMDVVVPAPTAGEDLRRCLAQIDDARGELDVRIIVATGDADFEPPAIRDIHVVRREGAHIFDLRALGVAASTAPIVAVTEDHCQVAPSWCQAILDAFEDPEVRFVKGPVANGTPCGPGAWANYFSNFSQHLADWPGGAVCATGGTGATTAWRRDAVDPPHDGARFHAEFLPSLADEEVHFAEGAHVTHWQCFPLAHVVAMQYHNARATGAFYRVVSPVRAGSAWLRLPRFLAGNALRLMRHFHIVRRHPGHRKRGLRILPAWSLVALVIGWGQWVGFVFGEGKSAHKVP